MPDRDNFRNDRLQPGETMADECACGHIRALHQDLYHDAWYIGADPCQAGTVQPCECRGGDYPRTAETLADMSEEGVWST